ncbi:protein SSUH2 homolog, partial [Trichonephila inaurata madagascariensis]
MNTIQKVSTVPQLDFLERLETRKVRKVVKRSNLFEELDDYEFQRRFRLTKEIAIPPPLDTTLKKSESEIQRSPLPSIPHLTEKEVRDALIKEVSTHCCYGTGAARDMAITEIKHSIAFHYTLETFTEKRTTCWAFEPYIGGPLEKLDSGDAPFPWDIPSEPPVYFSNHAVQLEVPYTASVKVCHVCGGPGRKKCASCSGKGWEYCFHCHGDGFSPVTLRTEAKDCLHCTGSGQR